MEFIEYPKCTTCKKAKKWLDDHGITYTDIMMMDALVQGGANFA